MKKVLIAIIIFFGVNFKAESQSFINEELNKQMIKEVRSKLKLSKKKKFIPNAVEVTILPIYWVRYPIQKKILSHDTLHDEKINRIFFNKLKLEYSNIKNKRSYEVGLIFSAIIYNNKDSALAQYSESKDFYIASTYTDNLLKAVKKYDIEHVFYIINIQNDIQPYYLMDKTGRIFVYVYDYKDDMSISYKVIPLEECTFLDPVLLY